MTSTANCGSWCGGLIAALVACSIQAGGEAELLWDTSQDQINLSTSLGSLNQFGADNQLADDFNLVGEIHRLVAHGSGCSSCGTPDLAGVYVRFFEWTGSGPGDLLNEFYVPDGTPGLIYNASNVSTIDVTLPSPFVASGWHFVSVQPHFKVGGEWRMRQANFGSPTGAVVQHRASHLGQDWHDDPEASNSDFSIEMWGALQSAAVVQSFDVAHTPSQRIVVEGSYFGAAQGESELLIGGVPAWVTTWTANTIIGYVPESVGPGTVDVIVSTVSGQSAAAQLEVVPRQQDGRVKWRFAVEADYMLHRPGIGPDGTIYINDLHGRVYAVSQDGGLLWITDALRGQEGLGSNGPVVVDANGRVYVGVEPLGPHDELVAINPDGSIAWVFTDPDALGIAAGPAVGPDGNIYIAFHDSDLVSSGATSLTPDGELRWSNNGDPPLYEYGAVGSELVFGPTTPDGPIDQVVLTVDRNLAGGQLYGFDMETGAQNFNTPVSGLTYVFEMQHQPDTNQTTGEIYLAQFSGPQGVGWNLQEFAPNGSLNWMYDPGIDVGLSQPNGGPDGNIYFAWDGGNLTKVNRDGQLVWHHDDVDGSFDEGPIVSPDNQVIAITGGVAQGTWWLKGISTADGSDLWRQDLPQENGNDIVTHSRPIFSADSSTAYIPTSNGGPVEFDYCYLYAIDARIEIVGDVDGNGVLDADDRALFCAAIGSSTGDAAYVDTADFNGDGTIDHLDLAQLNTILPACAGDVATTSTFAPPGDGEVDAADLAYLLGAWSAQPSCADVVSSKSFEPPPDGVVDGADLAFMLGAWGGCD